MNYKSFFCPCCKKHTRHEKISLAEYNAIKQRKKQSLISRILLDGSERIIGKVVEYIDDSRAYKCTECGDAHFRHSDGSIHVH